MIAAFGLAGYFALRKEKNVKIIVITSALVFISFFLRIIFADSYNYDYEGYWSVWCEYYEGKTLAQCLRATVSNYSPLNNYFFILFSKAPMYWVHSLSLFPIIFEILNAFIIIKIIEKVRGKKQSPILFALLLLIPAFFIDTTIYIQSDTIYTFFGLLGLYCVFCKKQILAFWFFGVSLALKVHAILIFPVIFILLFAKDKEGERYLDWRYSWILFFPFFFLNSLPLLAGKDFSTTFGIYILQSDQAVVQFDLTVNPSFVYLFKWVTFLSENSLIIFFDLLTLFFVCVTVLIVLKNKKTFELKDILFLMLFTQIIFIMFAPLFIWRYSFYLVVFAIIYSLSSQKAADIACGALIVSSVCFSSMFGSHYLPADLEWGLFMPSFTYNFSIIGLTIPILISVSIWYIYRFIKEYSGVKKWTT
jgi:hypothetical protein